MAAIINARINVANLPKEKLFKGKKGVYYNVTININDETRFGNNVAIYDSQTQEERESEEEKRNYTGNGKVIWTNGKIEVAAEQNATATTEPTSDLPF